MTLEQKEKDTSPGNSSEQAVERLFAAVIQNARELERRTPLFTGNPGDLGSQILGYCEGLLRENGYNLSNPENTLLLLQLLEAARVGLQNQFRLESTIITLREIYSYQWSKYRMLKNFP
jgi:hypothetical protein